MEDKENISPDINIIKSIDTNKNNFISIKEFLSYDESLGPYEYSKGKFKHYAMGSLSYLFLEILIKTNHPIVSKIVCLPDLNYCVYVKPGTNFTDILSASTDEPFCNHMFPEYKNLYRTPIKSNILFFNPPEFNKKFKKQHGYDNYKLVIPDSFVSKLKICKKNKKSIVFLNLFLTTTSNIDRIENIHANVLIVNLVQKTIERFDPHGGSTFIHNDKRLKNIKRIYKQELIDQILKKSFNKILPDYSYIDLNQTCPYLGPQSNVDEFGGLCVTWTLMYFLLRVLNVDKKQFEINKEMLKGTKYEVRNKVLRFQRYVIDTLRNAEE